MIIYAYIPLIAVVALTIRYIALPNPSVRSKWAVGCAALASAFWAGASNHDRVVQQIERSLSQTHVGRDRSVEELSRAHQGKD
jgi:hypothetical protein